MAAAPPSPRRRSGRPLVRRAASARTSSPRLSTYFGQHGYEYSKWADIAEAVGVGSTALYHYFESKLHCLYEIQALAVQADREKFERVVAEHEDFAEALRAVLNAAFELTDHEVMRNRVLVAEQSLVGLHRTSAREEEARQLARSQMRDLEFAWSTFLTRGMEQGAIPQADPRLLSRAILGPLQQRLALVPPARQPDARAGPRVLRRPLPRGRRPARPHRRAAPPKPGQAQAGQAQGELTRASSPERKADRSSGRPRSDPSLAQAESTAVERPTT